MLIIGRGSMGISEARARLACPLDVEETAHADGNRAVNKMARGIWAMLTKQKSYYESADGACVTPITHLRPNVGDVSKA
ncbi:MAG: hypothetical protein EOQ69_11125 [Mesorhizobium sp.]|nr:MAG: hypothetical protein EOQ69_11125 [Mesorhizobium sp.]